MGILVKDEFVGKAWVLGSLIPRPSYHSVAVRGPGNNSQRVHLIKTANYA